MSPDRDPTTTRRGSDRDPTGIRQRSDSRRTANQLRAERESNGAGSPLETTGVYLVEGTPGPGSSRSLSSSLVE